MVRQALDLSVYVLAKDKAALACQLYGRLHAQAELPDIAALRRQIAALGALIPLNEPVYELQAGGYLLRILRGHEGVVLGALELRDGRLLSWSGDGTLRLWAADGTERAVLRGHKAKVTGALELRDGRLLSWSGTRRSVCGRRTGLR
jgi:WD40 repeat protein